MAFSLPRLLSICLLILLFLPISGKVQAEDTLTTLLVLAGDEKHNKAEPRLQPYARDISEFFHYDTLSLIGNKSRVIREHSAGILTPNEVFYVRYVVLKQLRAHYQMRIDLLENLNNKEKLLVSTEVRLAKGAPIYVKGRSGRSGTLILILEIKQE